MKTRLLIIFVIGMMGTFGLPHLQYVEGICFKNQDWPDAPCYAIRTNEPWQVDEKKNWGPYYDFKGSEFMEAKKAEMLQALEDDNLQEWRREGPEDQHNNVFLYYYFQGFIPHEDGKYYEQHKQEEITAYYVAVLSEGFIPIGSTNIHFVFILIPAVAITAFVIWRKRK